MDYRHLEAFNAVATHGSVTAAAKALHMTQPALSRQIARLEQSLGLRLFKRDASGMRLTMPGETLLRLSSDISSKMREADNLMAFRYSGTTPFRLAAAPVTLDSVVAEYIAAVAPPIDDAIAVPIQEADALLDRDVDMVITSRKPPSHRAHAIVYTTQVYLQAPESVMESLPAERRGALEDHGSLQLIVPFSGLTTVLHDRAAALGQSIVLRDVATGHIAQALASNGHGLAVVSEWPTFGLSSVPATLGGDELYVSVYASWNRDHYAAAELRRLAEDMNAWASAVAPITGYRGPVSQYPPRPSSE